MRYRIKKQFLLWKKDAIIDTDVNPEKAEQMEHLVSINVAEKL